MTFTTMEGLPNDFSSYLQRFMEVCFLIFLCEKDMDGWMNGWIDGWMDVGE